MRITSTIFALVGCLSLMGCPSKEAPTRPEVQATANVKVEDFDLGLLSQLVNENKISGGVQEMEAYINDPSNGINYIDQDDDNKIDYVVVSEVEGQSEGIQLEFLAYYSSRPSDEPTPVATMNISRNAQQEVRIEAGYPSYVRGHDSHYYSHHHSGHGISLGEAYLLAHLFRPHPFYHSPFMAVGYRSSYGYAARPAASVRTSTRTSVRTRNQVGPVTKRARPSSFKAGPRAQQTRSRYARNRSGSNSGVNSYG